ncbi:hypothetical protein N7457_004225 [Penicillium paradoxum]|uniref:uncharacterized protein n=1 Tax=Penicillium paradoxum TaxID=176176 RepID=UPI002548482B|nr:uncharacterized protein N7457_004225 [Penicillium paradoxum]KAJ5782451.1 hypothetical protein N7457_004225 [Penicillium paradoxum]
MVDTLGQTADGYSHDNLRHVVITSTCFAFILSTTAVGFRIVSRAINGSGLFLDDWLIISALIFEYGISIAGVVLLYNGLGTHIIEVSPEQIVIYLKTLFTGSILYTCCIASIKLSILMLYRRIFPIKAMKYSVNVVSMIVILWAACGIVAGCFTCIPTEKLWHPELPGGCMNLSKFYYGLQIPNILTDAIILLMPIHIVWSLPISKAQKLGLSGIFVLGFLTLIFDIIRLVVLIELSQMGADITYNQVPASVWTCIEPAVGIVAACLANMRPLFKVLHTKVWSRISGRSGTNGSNSNRNNANRSSQSQIAEKSGWPRNSPSPTGDESHSTDSSSDLGQSPMHNQSAV